MGIFTLLFALCHCHSNPALKQSTLPSGHLEVNDVIAFVDNLYALNSSEKEVRV